MVTDLPRHVDVAIVGSGFAGIGTAIGLLRAGRPDFVILERADKLGGVWRDNSYPGCACDVPSHLYSFSFAPHSGWSHTFSRQREIEAYLDRTAASGGLLPHLHCATAMEQACWDAGARLWRVTTSRGDLTARVLVLGTGGLADQAVPELPGLGTFAGTSFHSASWRHDHDLAGERVAVIGTGASAIQFVPEIAPVAGHVTVFQRTPPWVLPRRDRAITPLERRVFRRFPWAQRAARSANYWGREAWLLGFAHPRLMARPERMARRFLAAQVADPALRAKLEPDYRLGCKRVLLSNTWYRTLTRPNVDVETGQIVEVRPHAVVTRDPDGSLREHHVDTIIFGTGFRATEPAVAARIVGAGSTRLSDIWSVTGMQALHGTTIAGFPNLFLMVGPNTGLGHTSVILMIEAQVRYLLEALATMDARGVVAVAPRPAAQQHYNGELQQQLAGTVWNTGGCRSWYLDPRSGKNTSLWPTFTFTYRRALRVFDPDQYELMGAA